MSRVPYISQSTADRISNCVEKLYEYISSGYPKDFALEKVASEYDLLPKQIRLVAHLYNNGLVNQFISDRDKKNIHESDSLIDPEPLIDNLFPKKSEKSASDDNISLWYLRSFNENLKLASGKVEPRTKSIYGHNKKDFVQEVTLENQLRKFYFREKTLYEQYKTASVGLQSLFVRCVEELQEYFKRQFAIHPEEVKKVASIYYPHLTKVIEEFIPVDKNRVYQENQPVIWSEPPYSILEEMDRILEKNANISEILKNYNEKFDKVDKTLFPNINRGLKKNSHRIKKMIA